MIEVYIIILIHSYAFAKTNSSEFHQMIFFYNKLLLQKMQ